ncbi:hypothetical protein DL96DRAFT_1499811 [Flagelloscypha sp. PMI_526]|nr:hypothetical protein DL96DRAFT_1499811 [Flagelloscypha sp. PMI_526]
MPKSLSRVIVPSPNASADIQPTTNVFVDGLVRRTRRRFTQEQLTMLENLYYRAQHPTRAQREEVAAQGGMEEKQVTIWFQNKRQQRRKDPNAPSQTTEVSQVVEPIQPTFMMGKSLDNLGPSTHHESNFYRSGARPNRTASLTSLSNRPLLRLSSASSQESEQSTRSETTRPSLDRVASRSELRVAPTTPKRDKNSPSSAGDSSPPIWERMHSSPLPPNNSPLASDYLRSEFVKKDTLEWACAKERQRNKEKGLVQDDDDTMSVVLSAASPSLSRRSSVLSVPVTDTETEDELMEAVTPEGSFIQSNPTTSKAPSPLGASHSQSSPKSSPSCSTSSTPTIQLTHDEEMEAALALCYMKDFAKSCNRVNGIDRHSRLVD